MPCEGRRWLTVDHFQQFESISVVVFLWISSSVLMDHWLQGDWRAQARWWSVSRLVLTLWLNCLRCLSALLHIETESAFCVSTGAPSATLATDTPARWLQGGYACAPVAVWHFTIVSGQWLPSCHRCSWAATAFHSKPDMRRGADTQQLWWQSIRSCWPRTMEQSSIAPERRWLILQWILAVAKDISVWTVGPRRSVNLH